MLESSQHYTLGQMIYLRFSMFRVHKFYYILYALQAKVEDRTRTLSSKLQGSTYLLSLVLAYPRFHVLIYNAGLLLQ